MINSIISALLQVLFFSLIPFIVYLVKKKKVSGFFEYIGLKKSTRKANLLALLLALFLALPLLLFMLIDENFKEVLLDPRSVTGAIRNMGLGGQSIIVILFTAIFKTALAEEIFFRGFLAKRLIAITNFRTGNWIQAIIFGLVHGLLFYSITKNVLFLAVIFIFPTITAYFKVYLNEKMANGSIIPGWIAHATANILAYSSVAFFI